MHPVGLILACAIACGACFRVVAPQAFKPMTEIYPEDSEQVKTLKNLFNAVDTQGFEKYFFDNNISPNIVDSHGRGVYHWWAKADLKAAGIFNPTTVVPILLILGNHTDRDLNIQDEDGNIPLHYFAIWGKDLPMKIHLNFGADPSIQNDEGKTPLHISAEKGFERVVSVIVGGREDSNSTKPKTPPANNFPQGPPRKIDPAVIYSVDNKGYTALHYAAASDFDLIAADLVQAVPNAEDLINFVPPGFDNVPSSFQLAIRNNSRRVVKAFLDLTKSPVELLRPDPQGYLPLQLATAFGHEKIVQLLLDKFAESNPDYMYSNDREGRNALHHAARFGRREIMEEILDRTPDERRKERLSSTGKNGWTPLHYASRYQHNFVVDLILKETTEDVNKKQSSGYTPLLLAALGCKAQPQAFVVKQLVRAGADMTLKSPRGETANDICVRLGCRRCANETALFADSLGQKGGPGSFDRSQCFPKKISTSPLFAEASRDGLTPISGKPCGTLSPQRSGSPFCFTVEVLEIPEGAPLTGPRPEPAIIGQGVLIDETLVSTSATVFYLENQLFPSSGQVPRTDVTYAIRVPGGVGGRRRLIPVSGQPRIFPGFNPSDKSSFGKDIALLTLSEPVIERSDGACFLCLPPPDFIPHDRCFTEGALQCRVISMAPDSERWSAYPAVPVSAANNSDCSGAVASRGAQVTSREVGHSMCVANIGGIPQGGPWCAGKSSALICDQGGTVRLFGHQSLPSSETSSANQNCGFGRFQGIFTPAFSPAVKKFYASGGASSEPSDESPAGSLFGGNNQETLFSAPSPFGSPVKQNSDSDSPLFQNNLFGGDRPSNPLFSPSVGQNRPGSNQVAVVRPNLAGGGNGAQKKQGSRFQIPSEHGPLSG